MTLDEARGFLGKRVYWEVVNSTNYVGDTYGWGLVVLVNGGITIQCDPDPLALDENTNMNERFKRTFALEQVRVSPE